MEDAAINAEAIARALGAARRGRDGWWPAFCHCHDDKSPSFAVKTTAAACWSNALPDASGTISAELRRRGRWPDGTREKSEAGRAGKKEKAADWRPIVPVPADAPPPTFEHVRLGRPASAWQYKDATGKVLGYTARFDKPDGGKDVLPYTFCQAGDGRRKWRSQSLPTPQLLYNLDKLAERPDDWVLVVEGEKSAAAAAELFLDHVVITSPGGSKAAEKADWSPLKGRKVAN